MDELMESQAFASGIAVGISLHQRKIVTAHERNEPIKVGDKLYFLQDGRQRLEEMLSEICK